jgi:threonine aldolase
MLLFVKLSDSFMSENNNQPQIQSIRELGMPMPTQAEWLAKIQGSKYLQQSIDLYNSGGLVEQLESRIATILGKPAALFFPKGMVAQLCALKVAAIRRNNPNIILHPKSHIAFDEQDAYQRLLGLQGIVIGEENAPFTMQQILSLKQSVSALTVELPLRRAGFKLTSWSELQAMRQWSQTNKVHFHMDGARLWESTEFYQKTAANISGIFDSVYVSLYKGLGAIGGSILAGEPDFIEECKAWRTRFGGDFFTSFPLVVSALDGLDERLEIMPVLVQRTKEIATALSKFSQLEVNPPQSTGFFVFVKGNLDKLNRKMLELNQAMGVKLCKPFMATEQADTHYCEIQVGAKHAAISNDEIVAYFSKLLT